MKILHLSTFDRFGAATGCIRLHRALCNMGVDSHLLTFHKTRDDLENHFSYQELVGEAKFWESYSPSALRYKKEKAVLDRIRIWAKTKNLYFSGISSRCSKITQLDLFESADIVNLHWVAGFIDWHSFWKTSSHKKMVWRLSDENPFSGAWHYRDENILEDISGDELEEFRSFEKTCFHFKKSIFMEHTPSLQVVTPSWWLNQLATQSELFSKIKHNWIPSSVSMDTFFIENRVTAREKLGLEVELPTFIFVSSELGDYRKGYDLLLEAFDKYEEGPVQFITVGSSRSEKQISNPKVICKHYNQVKDQSVLSSLYNAADWCLIPSRQDNLPNVFLEALACGTPVIANKVGGIEDFMPNSDLGILVQDEPWLEVIKKTASRLSSSRESIRAFAEENFAPQVQAGKYCQLYQDILAA